MAVAWPGWIKDSLPNDIRLAGRPTDGWRIVKRARIEMRGIILYYEVNHCQDGSKKYVST